MIELRETEIDALICKGLLKAEMRNDARAVREASSWSRPGGAGPGLRDGENQLWNRGR